MKENQQWITCPRFEYRWGVVLEYLLPETLKFADDTKVRRWSSSTAWVLVIGWKANSGRTRDEALW
jgi:hypothetical protein